jgi:hypothetical protein
MWEYPYEGECFLRPDAILEAKNFQFWITLKLSKKGDVMIKMSFVLSLHNIVGLSLRLLEN